jgi:hypothetical protein
LQRKAQALGNTRRKIRGSAAKYKRSFRMKKLLPVLIVVSMMFLLVIPTILADDMSKSQTVNGWVSDSKCGAKGASAAAATCTKKCLDAGAKPVVVTDSDQKVLNVDNPEALKGHEGHHVAVTGHITGDSIHVESVKML